MSDDNEAQKEVPQAGQEKEIVWTKCPRKGCDSNQAEKLPTRKIASAATAVRYRCVACGNTWSTVLGAPLITDI